MKTQRLCAWLLGGILWCGAADFAACQEDAAKWDTLASGLELGSLALPESLNVPGARLWVLRIDPARWRFTVLCADTCGAKAMTARGWAERFGLVAVTNAGMFHPSGEHVGFLQGGCCRDARSVRSYLSAFACEPRLEGLSLAGLYDLDHVSLGDLQKGYHIVVQNLRLIRHPGVNVWSKQPRKWSEAALGQDADGHILFLFCRAPLSMYDLNHFLLGASLRIVAAQHLEGGPEAQLYIRVGDREWNFFGSYETGFAEHDRNAAPWPVPNVIGIVPRQ